VDVCNQCGWWRILETKKITYGYNYVTGGYGATAYLKELDLIEDKTPVEEIRRYLRRNPDKRFTLDPFRFEDVVASIYKDMGHQVRATGHSRDGGIDIFLFDGPQDKTVGVQVKRYADKVEVDEVREFTGALFVNRLTRGVFVTTSSFTRGAHDLARAAATAGISIELIDSKGFFERLGISQQQYSLPPPSNRC
jgi:restriction system protein